MHMPEFSNPTTDRIAAFLIAIGLPVCSRPLPECTILPGIHIEQGKLIVDEAKLKYPGDLLHEAGHLAVISSEFRNTLEGDTGDDAGGEMAAIAWSYAAALHLGFAPEVVFHPGGYRGASQSIIANFAGGHYFGVPLLKWLGLAGDDYPAMIRWVLE